MVISIWVLIFSWACVKDAEKKSPSSIKVDKSIENSLKGKYVNVVTLDNYAPYTFSDSGNVILSREKISPGSDSSEWKGLYYLPFSKALEKGAKWI